jgi:hypothetical protein
MDKVLKKALLADTNLIYVGDYMDGVLVKKINPLFKTNGYIFEVFDVVADDGIYLVSLHSNKQFKTKQS